MSQSTIARDIANKFVRKHRSTFGDVDEKDIDAAVKRIARALKGLRVAERKAQRISDAAKVEQRS